MAGPRLSSFELADDPPPVALGRAMTAAALGPSAEEHQVQPGHLRPGDRVLFGVDDTPGRIVRRADPASDPTSVRVTFEQVPRGLPDDTFEHWVAEGELKLANNDVAVQTARAGLAQLLAEKLAMVGPVRGPRVAESYQEMVETVLSSPEAQRLIRLHG